MEWDIFISHASEDKEFVRSLFDALEELGLRVWFDETILNAGDSLRRSIDQGLSKSQYAIVVLSKNFFAKEWPQKELDGLVAREDGREKVIIPIWHNVTVDEVRRFSPPLSDKLSLPSSIPITVIAEKIARTIYQDRLTSKGWLPPSQVLPDETELVLLPIRPRSDVAIGISKYPTTNQQYQHFLSETGYKKPIGQIFRDGVWKGPFEPLADPEFNDPKQPVVCVDFWDALAYCGWVNKAINQYEPGLRTWGNWVFLPTTQLWDFAAWGMRAANQRSAEFILSEQQEIHHKSTLPVVIDESDGRTNSRGVSDMFGNVWEWCGDYHYRWVSIGDHARRVNVELQGGGFLDDLTKIKPHIAASLLKDTTRTRHTDLGFRIAAVIPTAYLPQEVQTQLSQQPRFSSEFWNACIDALQYPFYTDDKEDR